MASIKAKRCCGSHERIKSTSAPYHILRQPFRYRRIHSSDEVPGSFRFGFCGGPAKGEISGRSPGMRGLPSTLRELTKDHALLTSNMHGNFDDSWGFLCAETQSGDFIVQLNDYTKSAGLVIRQTPARAFFIVGLYGLEMTCSAAKGICSCQGDEADVALSLEFEDLLVLASQLAPLRQEHDLASELNRRLKQRLETRLNHSYVWGC